MNLRIAKKIYAAILTPDAERYTETQRQAAVDRMKRTASHKATNRWFNGMMDRIGVSGRIEILTSVSPSDAFDLMMRTPESEWR